MFVPFRRTLCSTVLLGLLLSSAGGEVRIVLKDEWIRKYMHRTTIDTCFYVDNVGWANFLDGDMHIAGRSDDVQVQVVAEIMNANSDLADDAVRVLRSVEDTGRCVRMVGAWRIWFEHGRNDVFVQGEPVAPAKSDNPNHVFEIHPVTRVGDHSLATTLRPITWISTRDPRIAFGVYESTSCTIRHSSSDKVTSISAPIVWRNYTEFIMEILDEPPTIVEDGRFLYAAVRDLRGRMLLPRRRMVLIQDSLPEVMLRKYGPGDRVHVLGMPRVSLALVDWRVQGSAKRPELLDAKLPYEMVIVGVYLD